MPRSGESPETLAEELVGHVITSTSAPGLPPLVGLAVVVISQGLERAFDRARGLDVLGYRVAACGDPSAVAGFVQEMSPEAVIVDLAREISTPDDTVARVRTVTRVPAVVVGCSGNLAEMTRCFDAGADDYTRPGVPTEEIDLRLRAIFRRLRGDAAPGDQDPEPQREVLQLGEIEIDVRAQVVRKRGITIPLSPTEFRLLLTLAEHPGSVIPAKALIARVWGNQYSGETHYLRLYVRYLRQKLEDDPSSPRYIVNRWGAGYALEVPAKAA